VGLEVDEFHHILTDAIFYVDFPLREKELASISVQRWYRNKRFRSQPSEHLWRKDSGYMSYAITMQCSTSVLGAERLLSGWDIYIYIYICIMYIYMYIQIEDIYIYIYIYMNICI
jgi:hypothetical protein